MSRPTITRADGYRMLWMPGHPEAHAGRVYEHRFVMERKLGRRLKPGEVVHHVNENPSDNRPENLELVESRGKHRNLHRRSECQRGHDLTYAPNVYVRPDNGKRMCYVCMRMRQRIRRAA